MRLSPERPLAATPTAGLLVVGVFTLLGLLEAGNAYVSGRIAGSPMPGALALELNLPWWWVWALLTPVLFWICRSFPLRRGLWRRNVVPHLLAGVTLAVIHIFVVGQLIFARSRSGRYEDAGAMIRDLLSGYLVMDIVTWLAIAAAWHAWDYHRRYVAKEQERLALATRAARLESQVSDARLEALRMQLNPHFLFNALHTVSALVRRQENATAVKTLSHLGDLLRTTLSHDPGPTVPLAEEIAYLQSYLAIELERFRDRLSVEIDVPPELLEAAVPTLILQPLVENSVRHGIGTSRGPGRITVRARSADGRLRLEVLDSGPGPGSGSSEGVGLGNSRNRLREMFGDDAALHLHPGEGGGTVVVVDMPLSWTESPAFDHVDGIPPFLSADVLPTA